ncbi:hypothetical protein [Natronobacterium gregoryi]|uniref:Uncharacterized protein n=2 Tax=Natronobacterium gregoryi TaxID=44930 RepID=L0AH88_NATGS|nr:hypothetical protein [Natronobacterium gregoryi]AFZ73263.1 hypothetical protein Natgr_2081 [Natronobacterium gregoryi SP2]ELY71278.1 hypothetical protein C490_05077 [Natronobacterium gregoryi SP2]PLK18762.1 hypothetical protein CYV19_17040 [Natronobacterium gregoryi SP2]SFJ64496.1 hypothetical protein SAMN05443661_1512 [Natronobacterium gregoryi]
MRGETDTGTARLRCFECGCEYGYLGSKPHPGRCPSCDSRCVSPAGELVVVDVETWQNATGLSKIWVHTIDERDRRFRFEIAPAGREGKVVAVIVEGTALDPAIDPALRRLPAVVSEVVAHVGVSDLEARRTSPA